MIFNRMRGIKGRGAGCIVFKTVVKTGEVNLVVDKMIQGEFEGARLNLFGKHHRDELTLGIGIWFVFCHCICLC